MKTVWVVRCLLLAIGAALAVALIARGSVLIGGLVAVLVLTRAVLFVALFRRRRELRRRFRDRMGNRF